MLGSTTFHLTLHPVNLTRRAARVMSKLVNLSTVPTKYHNFADIFSKAKAETLVLHCLYNLQIKLEDGEKLSVGTIYSLSTTKKEALKEFISENLNTRFIQLTFSLYRASVFFVEKKDGSLCLCVDF